MSKTNRILGYRHPTLKQQAAERARLIALLGWEPENGTAEGRYAATIGELLLTCREKGITAAG